MNIKILGTGCSKCKQLAQLAETAAKELSIACTFEKITKIEDILNFGVMLTPAMVVNGKVVFAGELPSFEQVKEVFFRFKE